MQQSAAAFILDRVLMKIVTLVLLLPMAATAQTLPTTDAPKTYRVGPERAMLFRTAADTARPSGFFLAPQEQVSVVGRFSPRALGGGETHRLPLLGGAQ